MDTSQRIKSLLALAAIIAVAFFIGWIIWDDYQNSRCERIIMEIDERNSAEAVKCFERFSG